MVYPCRNFGSTRELDITFNAYFETLESMSASYDSI